MEKSLSEIKVAILVTDGFEQSELTEPKNALEKAGAKVYIVSPNKEKVKGWKHGNWSDEFQVNFSLENTKASDYNALVLPGGVINPDKLRLVDNAIEFIKYFVTHKKPIAAICHGPWTLINANGVKGRQLTSWGSIKTDLTNAGANWVDREVVRDDNLVTSRKPDDLPAFNATMIELFNEIK